MSCPHCYANEGDLHQGWCLTQENFARASQLAQPSQWINSAKGQCAMTREDLGIVDELLDDKVGMDG